VFIKTISLTLVTFQYLLIIIYMYWIVIIIFIYAKSFIYTGWGREDDQF